MFLNLLNPEQQRLFVHAARAVAEQDGHVADVEGSLLGAILAESGLEADPGPRSLDEVLEELPDALADGVHARNAFVLELAGVAVIDGDAHPAEMTSLRRVAERVGVAEGQLAEFVAFALAARELVVRGRELVATGSGV